MLEESSTQEKMVYSVNDLEDMLKTLYFLQEENNLSQSSDLLWNKVMVQNKLKYGMFFLTWRNARTGNLFVTDARSILLQDAKKPDISYIEKKI